LGKWFDKDGIPTRALLEEDSLLRISELMD